MALALQTVAHPKFACASQAVDASIAQVSTGVTRCAPAPTNIPALRYTRPAMTIGSPQERRRSPRRLLDVPLIVSGATAENQPFTEETFTISVSAHGALVLLAARVALGQTVVLIKPETRQEQQGRVSRLGAPYGGLAQGGGEFSQPAPEFWPDSVSA